MRTSEFDTPGERSLRSGRMRPSFLPYAFAAVLLLGVGAARAAQATKPAATTLERAADIPDAEKLSRSRDAVPQSALTHSDIGI